MKNKSKSCLIALAATVIILFLILGPSVTSAAPLAIAETKMTNSGNASNAEIYGNRIVWQDTRNGGNPDIYVYDTSTKKETRITKSGSAVNPAIYGNLIVWNDGWNGNGGDIYMYDLSAKKETRITKTGNVSNPDIYGNKIVWDGGGIFLYDLSAKKITQIAKNSYVENDYSSESVSNYNPIIYENKIAWISTSTYSDSIETSHTSILYIYDFSTKKETKIDEDSFFYSSIYSHDIYNNRIVWFKDYKDPTDTERPGIFMYDLSTKKYTQVTYYAGSDLHIFGNRIVWQGDRDESDIWMYDLSTKNETKITTGRSASNPAIYGDRIVWQDSSNGYPVSDIYLGTLSSKPTIVATFSASPVTGKAPLKVQFADKSTGSPTSWSWNFGDKTTSTVKNPAHTYSKAGKYTVSLTVKNTAGSNSVTKSSYITALNPPVAAFSASPVTGKAPLTVKFADKSTGSPASWSWNFGDKSVSTAKNPSHKYAKAGKYTVSLTVKNAAGSNTAKKANYITVK